MEHLTSEPLENPSGIALSFLDAEMALEEREGSALKGVISAMFMLLIAYALWGSNWLGVGGLVLAFYYFVMLEPRIETVACEPREIVREQTQQAEGQNAINGINWARAWMA
ncbi:MAG: hypothetical protein HY849_05810 [Nitrosomonadales bacterium]|nr:hypothetical protein [Nitrosomonadales bacterium]